MLLFLAALIIAILLIVWAIRVIKETLWTTLVILLLLALLFGLFRITPTEVYQEIWQIPARIQEWIPTPEAQGH